MDYIIISITKTVRAFKPFLKSIIVMFIVDSIDMYLETRYNIFMVFIASLIKDVEVSLGRSMGPHEQAKKYQNEGGNK